MERTTEDEFGFIIKNEINQLFEYSNNDDKNFWKLSLYLKNCRENKVLPPSEGGKNILVFNIIQNYNTLRCLMF